MCLEQENDLQDPLLGWLVLPHGPKAWVLSTPIKHSFPTSGHCSGAPVPPSWFLGLGTWISVALI